jgi:2',3'-cyclic-nucleotide 2'-phosphodiesterase (5'-nucleotidase family)
MRPRSWRRLAVAVGLATATAVLLVSSVAQGAQTTTGPPFTSKLLLYSSDGMRPDLMSKYVGQGQMPTYASLIAQGVQGDNGMVQAFPPNTGVGWYTMATGTYPSEHGSTNNTFHRTGDAFSNRTSFASSAVLQADTIAAAAERAGKKVAQVEWTGGINAGIRGPTVDFATFYSRGGVLVGQSDPSESAGAAAFGLPYQVGTWVSASGWSNVPLGDPAAPPMEISGGWSIPTTSSSLNPNRLYNVYAYDGNVNGVAAYDHVIVVPGLLPSGSKDGSTAGTLDLKVGDFKQIRLTGVQSLIGSRAGESAGHYVKLISLAPDLSNFKLYSAEIARPQAKCGTPCNGLPAGIPGEDRLEKYIADTLPVWAGADFAPEEAGIIDEDTYVQQGRDLEVAYGDAVLNYVLGTLQPDTDLALVGYPATDEFSHQFMALVTPTDIDGNPNPCYDVMPKFSDVTCTGAGTAGRVAIREGYIRSVYHEADSKLALARSLLGGNPATFAASDHGFAPQWFAVNAQKVLHDITVNGHVVHASDAASNCAAVSSDLAKACWAGGTIQIYVNPTLPSGTTYEQVRTAVINAFTSLTDPANPSATVVAKVMKKEELRNVDGSDSLHPNRSGDVVVVLRPPYQSDAGTNGQAIALSHFFGQHGYMPNLVDLAHNVNMHATFVAAGPGIRHQDTPVAGLRAIDIAPTAAYLLGVPGPQNARGKILTGLTTAPSFKTWTILDISDYHGQLIPLTEASDTLGPSFAIGGAAFLKPWFDIYRAEAPNGTITVAAGDSVGATPPISSFFGDKPTITEMNNMGFSADGLGNHNFDKGQAYLRNTLIPLANFPYVSANIVDSNGNTPAEWSPSHVFSTTFDGGKLGLIGFSNDDLPDLTSPGNLTPFHVTNSTAAVNAEAAKLKASGVQTIVAMGHLGATAGTLSAPTGPLIDLADNVTNVDAVIGDHTDFQVDTTRPNGVLVTENRSKGIRFTRVRLVIDPSTKKVVYKTADFHKPWDIGITPDPAIQADIDALNAQLAPILNAKVGDSTKYIPRADQCGGSTGRTCESLVGNVVADSMRTKYSSIGVQFAITNSGGLRADLTCPTGATDPNPSDFCPASLYPIPTGAGLFPITRGQVLTVLPFGNVVATVSINGAELKSMLENGVSFMPAVAGRFPQVSGLCFTYDITQNPGSRVVSAVLADSAGNCTATPIDLTASGGPYKIAENDFMAAGGDGYPVFNVKPGYATQDIMDQVLADYLSANDPVSPFVKAFPDGRVNCLHGAGPLASNTCPILTPSFP